MKRIGFPRVIVAGLALVASAAIISSSAQAACEAEAQTLIDNLKGAWRGAGTVQPIGGAKERISCRVDYKTSGPKIVQSISCAGTDYKIDAGADVSCNGTSVSGQWNEQIANNTGRIKGSIQGKNLRLEVDGPNFKGRFAVKFTGASRHSLTITQFDPAAGRHVPIAEISLRR
jgi:hypothetical protein